MADPLPHYSFIHFIGSRGNDAICVRCKSQRSSEGEHFDPNLGRIRVRESVQRNCMFLSPGREWLAMKWLEQMRIDWLERGLAGLNWAASRRERKTDLPAHLATGIEGEDAALFYLRRKGYVIVARRWSSGNAPGDIDLVAWQGPMLCIVEVKTRTAHDLAAAEVAVDSHKRNTLRKLARQYIRQLPQETAPPVRFDVISVYLVPGHAKEFVHFEGSFGWSEERDLEDR
jgi:putative endonuclease